MFEQLRGPLKRLIRPLALWLAHHGVGANAVTIIGSTLTIIVSLATGITGWLFPGVVALTVIVLFDALDGSIAALTTGGTPFGAFLDSTLDRIADWAVISAVLLYFAMHTDWSVGSDGTPDSAATVATIGMAAALVGMMTTFVTSYARARAEAVGVQDSIGLATRSDRLVIILVGMGVTGLTGQTLWLMAAMIVLAVLGIITVIQRIAHAHHEMNPAANS